MESFDTWSANGEDFGCDSIGELLDREDVQVGSVVYKGTATRPKYSQLFNTDDVIETIEDRAYDIGGEYSERVTDNIKEEAVKELNSFLQAWMEKWIRLDFYSVSNIQEYVITEDDVTGCD